MSTQPGPGGPIDPTTECAIRLPTLPAMSGTTTE